LPAKQTPLPSSSKAVKIHFAHLITIFGLPFELNSRIAKSLKYDNLLTF